MINPVLIQHKITKETFKILATNEKWIHIFQIATGEISTVSSDKLKDSYIVVIPKSF